MIDSLVVGLFVGGSGRRMGGVAKGLLKVSAEETLVSRLIALCRATLGEAPLCFVGEASRYAEFELPVLADAPSGVGPLGGLRALLQHGSLAGHSAALVLACDLPYIGQGWLRRLATTAPRAIAVAPRVGTLWYPLSARYATRALSSVEAALLRDERSLQRLFAGWGSDACALECSTEALAELSDWDRPEDVPQR